MQLLPAPLMVDLSQVSGARRVVERFVEVAEHPDRVAAQMGQMMMLADTFGLPRAALLSAATNGRVPELVAECRGWLARLDVLESRLPTPAPPRP